MANVAIKNEKITAFGGINFVLDKFDALLGEVIDRVLGIRSTTTGYQYSEIIRSIFAERYEALYEKAKRPPTSTFTSSRCRSCA